MKKWWALSLLAVLIAGFMITLWFAGRVHTPSASGAFQSADGRSSPSSIALAAGYGFAMTLFGVLLGAAYRRLIKLRADSVDATNLLSLLKSVVASVDFQIGLVGAPIIYGFLWQSLADVSLAGLTVIALQNGFASHAILEQFAMPKSPKDPV